MPVNTSNLKHLPFFTPKGHPRVCWVIWIFLQLQRTEIENARVNTIDTTNIIYCINQYEDNRYYWSDRLTLQTSPTQMHHFCFLFRFSWLIKLRSIVVLHPVSSFWCAHLFLVFCFCFPLNIIVVPTAEVRLVSQRGMDYFCVYHNHMFLPGFLLLIETSYCVPGAINCNKEDVKMMSSIIQDYDHQSSGFSFWFGGVIRLIGGY